MDGNNKLKNSVKGSDKAGISGAEVMIETATGLSVVCNEPYFCAALAVPA